jgi:hypothetical protein
MFGHPLGFFFFDSRPSAWLSHYMPVTTPTWSACYFFPRFCLFFECFHTYTYFSIGPPPIVGSGAQKSTVTRSLKQKLQSPVVTGCRKNCTDFQQIKWLVSTKNSRASPFEAIKKTRRFQQKMKPLPTKNCLTVSGRSKKFRRYCRVLEKIPSVPTNKEDNSNKNCLTVAGHNKTN